MSTERLSLGFNSLIPENYKTQAEAFAKCLQHKLLSLRGQVDKSSESTSSCCQGQGSRKGQGSESGGPEEEKKGFKDFPSRYSTQKELTSDQRKYKKNGESPSSSSSSSLSSQGRKGNVASVETGLKLEKTEDSDEDEFYSHSESENGDSLDHRKLTESKPVRGTKKKLTSMSSEDSTIESWSSCQDFADFEKFADLLKEESNQPNATQVKPFPKSQVSNNLPNKRSESREKSRKKNSKRRQSEEANPEGTRQPEDLESHLEGIHLDEDEETSTSGRELGEPSSTSGKSCHDPSDVPTNEGQPTTSKQGNETFEEKEADEKLSSSELGSKILSEPEEFPKLERDESKRSEEPTITHRVFLIEGSHEEEEVLECHVSLDGKGEFPRHSVYSFNNDQPSPIQSGKDFPDESKEAGCSNESNTRDDHTSDGNISVVVDTADESDESHSTDDDRITRKTKLQRSSSLKTWKTPPGTPGSKKIVRFADALGLDLADVRTFLDEVPKIPSSAYSDLHFDFSFDGGTETQLPIVQATSLVPAFQQPGLKMDFYEKVRRQKICLEMVSVTDPSICAVTGYVRVINLAFDKSVFVRYTLNKWETFSDLQASYVHNSCDGFTDKFSFVLYGHTLKAGDRLEFALRLESGGTQYWDNHGGINYIFNCLPDSSTNRFFSSVYDAHLDPCFNFY